MAEDQRAKELQQSLAKMEALHGKDSLEVAESLQQLASYLKQNNVRLLDAANMQARAGVILSNAESERRPSATVTPPATRLVSEMETCQRCGEPVKLGAECFFCNSPVFKKSIESSIETERKCPFCAELIKMEAIKCRFCGSSVPPADTASRAQRKAHLANQVSAGRITDREFFQISAAPILLLLIVVSVGYAATSAGAGAAFAVLFIWVIGFFYFAPVLVAITNRKRNVVAIGALNLFLGWTVLGWVVSLIWALAHD